MSYHLPAPSSAYKVTFLCLILQATRPTTLQQKEYLMQTPSKHIKYQPTHTETLPHMVVDQLSLITENSCSVVPNMQGTTVRPPREEHRGRFYWIPLITEGDLEFGEGVVTHCLNVFFYH